MGGYNEGASDSCKSRSVLRCAPTAAVLSSVLAGCRSCPATPSLRTETHQSWWRPLLAPDRALPAP